MCASLRSFARACVCVCVCVRACVLSCVHACACVCVHVCVCFIANYVHIHLCESSLSLCMSVCVRVSVDASTFQTPHQRDENSTLKGDNDRAEREEEEVVGVGIKQLLTTPFSVSVVTTITSANEPPA